MCQKFNKNSRSSKSDRGGEDMVSSKGAEGAMSAELAPPVVVSAGGTDDPLEDTISSPPRSRRPGGSI